MTQFRSEIRERDSRPAAQQDVDREAILVTGSQKIFIVPQVSYIFRKDWLASVIVDLPLYQYYNSKQLASTYAVSLSVSREFKPKMKKATKQLP